jgi:Arc/MetJ-type ribon-helix-helix transcriptional regulator
MKSFNLTIPEELLDYVRHRTKEAGFGTPTEFMRHLIRKDREDRAERALEAKLLRAIQSGRAKGDVSGLFKRLHKRVDEIEREQRARKHGAK